MYAHLPDRAPFIGVCRYTSHDLMRCSPSLVGAVECSPLGRHLPETKARLQAEYRDRHRDTLRQKQRDKRRRLKQETLDVYGNTCAHCGFSDPRALQVDHIDNSGAVERRSLGGKNFSGWRFYDWLRKQGWPSGYQTLCANCNLIKHFGDDF